MRTLSTLAVCAAVCGATTVSAQPRALAQALADPRVSTALKTVDDRSSWTASVLVRLGAVVSPSGHERERAQLVAATMREIGLQRVTVDDAPNVVGTMPGRSGRSVVFVSTLDDLGPVAAFQKAAA
ncbi:MAG TPA: hypothetical protein VGY48_23765, partial [Vicinamibacterales bacterium]|nr:hypothetical protein [Vicinamibacterales bacterium]